MAVRGEAAAARVETAAAATAAKAAAEAMLAAAQVHIIVLVSALGQCFGGSRAASLSGGGASKQRAQRQLRDQVIARERASP